MDEAPTHRRFNLRLKNFDYSQPGYYFVTICVPDWKPILSRVFGGKVILNQAGTAVHKTWLDLPRRFPSINIHEFVVMPNHFHGILQLTQPIRIAPKGAASSAPTTGKPFEYPTVGKVLRAFKSISAIDVNRILVRKAEPVWQRGYYDHIIRTGQDFEEIRAYILENPARWEQRSAQNPGNSAF
jgi:putative transposase